MKNNTQKFEEEQTAFFSSFNYWVKSKKIKTVQIIRGKVKEEYHIQCVYKKIYFIFILSWLFLYCITERALFLGVKPFPLEEGLCTEEKKKKK